MPRTAITGLRHGVVDPLFLGGDPIAHSTHGLAGLPVIERLAEIGTQRMVCGSP